MSEIWVVEVRSFDEDSDEVGFTEWSAGRFIEMHESEEKANSEIDKMKSGGGWAPCVQFRAAKYTRTEPQE